MGTAASPVLVLPLEGAGRDDQASTDAFREKGSGKGARTLTHTWPSSLRSPSGPSETTSVKDTLRPPPQASRVNQSSAGGNPRPTAYVGAGAHFMLSSASTSFPRSATSFSSSTTTMRPLSACRRSRRRHRPKHWSGAEGCPPIQCQNPRARIPRMAASGGSARAWQGGWSGRCGEGF